MTIYEINKLLSSPNKSKLISHFWDCNCKKHTVNDMCLKLDMLQSNLSKHINTLLKLGVFSVSKEGKQRYYSINQEFKKKWKKIIEPQVKSFWNYKYYCDCNK